MSSTDVASPPKMLINLYGKTHDITLFKDKHPGGTEILKSVEGMEDATPLFESYHSLHDIEKIKVYAKKYQLENAPPATPNTTGQFEKSRANAAPTPTYTFKYQY